MSVETDIEEIEPGLWDATVLLDGMPVIGNYPFPTAQAAQTWANSIARQMEREIADDQGVPY